jgi:UV DNA damage endonuclease
MVRLSSDLLPAYTHKDYSAWYKQPDVRSLLESGFAKVGDAARALGVRISFHPGQFCVLASASDGIIDRSIEEFEYHTDVARFMGFGKKFQDMKINVHISGKRGPQGIRDALQRVSPEARNMITIENDEMSWGVEASLELMNDCALVLDIHHHWIRTGEYIQPDDIRFKRIIESWRGVQPVIHYSVSREDVLVNHDLHALPDHAALLNTGHNKSKLRAHSDFYWNTAVNNWAGSFQPYTDIMCESKGKNLASAQFAEQVFRS